MTEGPYRKRADVVREAHRCLFCGGMIDHTDLCSLCSIEAAPPSRLGEEQALACPRCHLQMSAVHLSRAVISQCNECRGCFVAASDWSEVVSRLCAGDGELGVFVPPPPGKELTPEQRLASCKCPVCDRPMERARFGAKSPIAIDVCSTHGDWFDSPELVACAQYVQVREARGNTLSEEELAEERAWRRAMAEARYKQDLGVSHVATIATTTRMRVSLNAQAGPIVGALELVGSIFSSKRRDG